MWFAEKFVSLLIEQHPSGKYMSTTGGCDLLKNSYLCLLNNTTGSRRTPSRSVVICWKIRIFAYWTTPMFSPRPRTLWLWFAEKFVSLLIEQHQVKNLAMMDRVVICWKIRIFAYWTTPTPSFGLLMASCDLLKNSYLCLLNNTHGEEEEVRARVVICWKIRIFAYWTTPSSRSSSSTHRLWFAEKFVSLLIEQHRPLSFAPHTSRCDLLKNSYLCLLNNTIYSAQDVKLLVVICWKIRIFAYWTTPGLLRLHNAGQLWFAEKFVSLLIEQHLT